MEGELAVAAASQREGGEGGEAVLAPTPAIQAIGCVQRKQHPPRRLEPQPASRETALQAVTGSFQRPPSTRQHPPAPASTHPESLVLARLDSVLVGAESVDAASVVLLGQALAQGRKEQRVAEGSDEGRKAGWFAVGDSEGCSGTVLLGQALRSESASRTGWQQDNREGVRWGQEARPRPVNIAGKRMPLLAPPPRVPSHHPDPTTPHHSHFEPLCWKLGVCHCHRLALARLAALRVEVDAAKAGIGKGLEAFGSGWVGIGAVHNSSPRRFRPPTHRPPAAAGASSAAATSSRQRSRTRRSCLRGSLVPASDLAGSLGGP